MMTTTSTSPRSSSSAGPAPGDIAARLAGVRARIRAVAGPQAGAVRIVGVTKTHPRAVVEAGIAAGLTAIGESYAQELVAKFGEWRPAVEVQFIGRLQTNKVRQLAGRVDVVASVDRAPLVAELARRIPGGRVMIQVNATGETGKGGCPLGEVTALVDAAGTAGLTVDGLMTVGPTDGDVARTQRAFATVRALVDRLGLGECSMGMSDDLELAVAEGSTQVRLGTALFGVRSAHQPAE